MPVTVPSPAEYVALGAARQAAWALAGLARPAPGVAPGRTTLEFTAEPTPQVREQYAALRDATAAWGS